MRRIRANGNGTALKCISIVGARPQFIKLGPICRAIKAHNENSESSPVDHRILHTGQHYDREMASLPSEQMELPEPAWNLEVGPSSPAAQLARMVERLEPVLEEHRPSWVIVYGDTTSTLAGALVSARLRLPIVHVEAGCRSGDMDMPEEQARIVADHLSQLLLAPSLAAMHNLEREGIGVPDDPRHRRAVFVGDVMYDALLQNQDLAEGKATEVLQGFGLASGDYCLLTLHRAENTDNIERLRMLLTAIARLNCRVLFPIHPRTKAALDRAGIVVNGNILAAPPQGYLEMLALEKHARKILTDSGGVQKEAFYLAVPCVTFRDTSEWPETVAFGANRIAGSSTESIGAALEENERHIQATAFPYGIGNAAHLIIDQLLKQ
jgi:UDP-N-acetylglucosamine 2-epimerase